MKVLSVVGVTKSGKTTTVENIIIELKKRGYSVGSVKEIHYESFAMDTKGTNTYRHKKAGAQLVTARGLEETDILYQRKLSMDEILKHYDYDYVILEGVEDINAPIIVTAYNEDDIERKADYRTLLVSGKIADKIKQYDKYKVMHCIDDIVDIVDLIEKAVPPMLPDFDEKCCNECGYCCRGLLENIIKGTAAYDACTINRKCVKLEINGMDIKMVPFVQNILENSVLAIIKELDGYEKTKDIKITIRNIENGVREKNS